jgi:PAT family beta-lactamase induction signal transducer AmpG
VIKPLWSPFIDLYATKKVVLAMQLVISIAFLLVGLTIHEFFVISLAIFWVAAFASASNDVASDGLYVSFRENNNLFPNTQYSIAFHAYRKWIDCNNRWLSKKYGDKRVVLHHGYCRFDYGCLNHLQLFFYT